MTKCNECGYSPAAPTLGTMCPKCDTGTMVDVEKCAHCGTEEVVEPDSSPGQSAYFCKRCSDRMEIGPFPDIHVGGKPYKWIEDKPEEVR